MAGHGGEYGYPYPRVDQYGNPVGPVDQYGVPIPREPSEQPAYSSGANAPSFGASDVTALSAAGVTACDVLGGAAHGHTQAGAVGVGLAPGETTVYPREGVVARSRRRFPGRRHAHAHAHSRERGERWPRPWRDDGVRLRGHGRRWHRHGRPDPASQGGAHDSRRDFAALRQL
jgi:hypothetical protein